MVLVMLPDSIPKSFRCCVKRLESEPTGNLQGGGGGGGYKVIGAHTDLCTSLQRQLGKQDFYSNSSVAVCVGGKMWQNSYVSHVNMHVYC